MPRLRDTIQGTHGIDVELTDEFFIGRGSKNDLNVLDNLSSEASSYISRRHVKIRRDGDSYFVKDVGSSNGTIVNGWELPPNVRVKLYPGDIIAIPQKNARLKLTYEE